MKAFRNESDVMSKICSKCRKALFEELNARLIKAKLDFYSREKDKNISDFFCGIMDEIRRYLKEVL